MAAVMKGHSTVLAEGISSARRVMDAIITGVEHGRFVPGQRLIEADLTSELKVSRGPVREAFTRLAGEGVLVLSKNRGAFVRAQTREEAVDMMSVLEALAGLAAKLAATHIDEGRNRKKLQRVFAAALHSGEAGETLGFLEQRREFYDTLYDIGGNNQLAQVVPRLKIALLRLQFKSFVSREQHELQLLELSAIAEAVLMGDPKKAESVARLHLRRRRTQIQRLPDEAYAAARAN
jgi:DNA-binding GntR family transcriptional regulator